MPFPGRESEVIVLNTWREGDVSLTQRRGTLASGKQRKARYAIDVKSEPLLMDLDEMNLGGAVADAWLNRIKDQWHGISVVVSDTTQAMRVKAGVAFQQGASWALKRYSGGRIGAKAPNQTNKFGMDSLRTVDGLTMRPNLTDSSYTINAPANRMNPDTFGAGFDAYMTRLVELIPVLDPKRALGDKEIEGAIKQGVADMVSKAEANSAAAIERAKARLKAQKIALAKQIGRAVTGALGF